MPTYQHHCLSAISVASTREVPGTASCEAHEVLDHLEHLAKKATADHQGIAQEIWAICAHRQVIALLKSDMLHLRFLTP